MTPLRAWHSITVLAIAHGLAVNAAYAGIITTVDVAKANANDSLTFNSDFGIDTGTAMAPVTTFMFGGKNYMGRTVTPNNGTPIVIYDLTTLTLDAGTTLTIRGSLPIGFVTLDVANVQFDISIAGTLSVSADGQTPGAGGGAGGRVTNPGSKATGAETGAGGTGTGTAGGAGGGGGYGGKGGQGAIGPQERGNRTGGVGGDTYGSPELTTLFGGGGGGGSKVGPGERPAVGGGGGGGILLSTKGKISVSGRVEADGARGGDPSMGMGGGGGAGGSILLEALDGVCEANSVVISGRVSAKGGSGGSDNVRASGGGGGGGGRVFVSDCFADLSRVNVRGGSGGFTTTNEPLELQGKAGDKGTVQTAPKPVPSPSSLLLVVSGLVVGLAGLSRRRNRWLNRISPT